MHAHMTTTSMIAVAALAVAALAGAGTASAMGAPAARGITVQDVTRDTPPVFVRQTPPITAAAGHAYQYAFSASGSPPPAYALATGSWAWLHVNTATGEVSGTVPVGITSFSYTVTASNTAGTATAGPFAARVTGTAGPYATVVFSRTEMTAADDCDANGTGIAQIATTVAPYLNSLGIPATGTLQTGSTRETARFCTHYRESLGASWADATNLATNFGWSFGSHTATYPRNIDSLPPARAYAETAGSAATIDAHGLPGAHGIIAYPGSQPPPVHLQTNYSAKYFAWGRRYMPTGTTPSTAGSTAPYWQQTAGLSGGSCNTATASCYRLNTVHRYTLPGPIITKIKALKPGQWFTLQAFILVTGTNPPYTHNATRWDCTSTNPKLHWANDNERYCYRDWRQIVSAIAAVPHVVVTDPLTVGIAFGRPATYPSP